MQASGIGASSAASLREPTSRGFAEMKSEDFFSLLITQLQAQDPLKPTDNQQLLSQMSMIRQMEQSTTLNKTLGALASEQRFGATAGLIGNYVMGSVTDSGGNPVTVEGVVIGVQYEGDGSAVLALHDGKRLPAEKVEEVTLVDNLPPEVLERIQAELGGPGLPDGTDPADEEIPAAGDAANPTARGRQPDLLSALKAALATGEKSSAANHPYPGLNQNSKSPSSVLASLLRSGVA